MDTIYIWNMKKHQSKDGGFISKKGRVVMVKFYRNSSLIPAFYMIKKASTLILKVREQIRIGSKTWSLFIHGWKIVFVLLIEKDIWLFR